MLVELEEHVYVWNNQNSNMFNQVAKALVLNLKI